VRVRLAWKTRPRLVDRLAQPMGVVEPELAAARRPARPSPVARAHADDRILPICPSFAKAYAMDTATRKAVGPRAPQR